ncbi:MAG: DHH family phosphoesterase [Methylobacter sp.]|uniref:DHH family phosphoesterase n=1 Tax=Candidatus Methylobacter titanis TaxID=3053457 RepID=A0AA43Q532_9GAMM|nr:DHH family phosphoesterase [Candidatus Methylobacter titanis]MDI1294137.1 DHH family phosphoesterase [Candidatus Methylobacter titanis]
MSETNETLVIYHADCLDGLGAAWSAFCQLGSQVRYIPASHGDTIPDFEQGAILYILDFSYPPQLLVDAAAKAGQIILIDHHITAMEQCDDFFKSQPLPENLSVNFDMSRSGCVLTWQYFFPDREPPQILLHIEDRDIWHFKLDGTREITTALFERMPINFAEIGAIDLAELLAVGRIQLAQFTGMVNRLAKSAHSVTVAGRVGLAVNAPSLFSSDLGHVLAEKSGTFGMTYQYNGRKQQWHFSLRSIGDYDVGHLALSFGGGGHKNAAGFVMDNNPFLTIQ